MRRAALLLALLALACGGRRGVLPEPYVTESAAEAGNRDADEPDPNVPVADEPGALDRDTDQPAPGGPEAGAPGPDGPATDDPATGPPDG